MKKSLKILAAILCFALVISAFAACGEKVDDITTTAPADTEQSESDSAPTLDLTSIRIATNAEFDPYEFIDENDEFAGIEIDMMKVIAEKLGITYSYDNMDFGGVIAAVSSGSCDIATSGLTITEERKLSVDFTDPYHQVTQIVITTADNTAYDGLDSADAIIELLKNETAIGVCEGYTGEAFVKDPVEDDGLGIDENKVNSYKNIALALQDLSAGNISVIVYDSDSGKTAISAEGNEGLYKFNDTALTTEDYAFAVQKGNEALLSALNEAIAEMKSSGKLAEIFASYGLEA